MSRADELLKKLIYQVESFDINYNRTDELAEAEKLYTEIESYLNRKHKLVICSEWVCDVECYATNGNKTYRIGKNKALTITFFEEGNCNVYFYFYDDVLDVSYLKNTNIFKFDEVKTSCVIPTEQFLACFSPKENL